VRCTVLLVAIVACAATPAAAQERPFLFSIATTAKSTPAIRFDYDVGTSERTFQSDATSRPEQRIGAQAALGRLTLLARFGISDVGSSYQSSQSGELLYSMLGNERAAVAVAAGGGVLHEAGGVNVLLARLTAGHNADSWLLHGNMVFQKPMSSGRDELDVVTSLGWARKFAHGVSLGAEMVGEDLEGFWEAEEAEGGARLLVGPSVRVAPAGRKWQLIATGGPLFHPSDTGRASAALRDLPPETRSGSYVFKAALSISLDAGR
jgi:hypothetical protein